MAPRPTCPGLYRMGPDHMPEKDQCHRHRSIQTPVISIDDHTLEVVKELTYIGTTIAKNLFLDVVIKSVPEREQLSCQSCP